MAGDANCAKHYGTNYNSQLVCADKDGNRTGVRNPMSDYEVQQWNHKQQLNRQETSAAINSFSNSLSSMGNSMLQQSQSMDNNNYSNPYTPYSTASGSMTIDPNGNYNYFQQKSYDGSTGIGTYQYGNKIFSCKTLPNGSLKCWQVRQ
ncbi:hypothetical protein [Endozoicomonas sp. SESOKO1]|uniref:hypothetical protein n=1 Tax=Endozoicomonas sp. SESOKO1 TaxID=2828742 RepID=UPI0021491D30|nr:hypothetical protein [Endozoicomonas sp. SESOKO1]